MLSIREISCGVIGVFSSFALAAAGVSGQGTWETTLEPRDVDDDGVTDAYYDTVLDVTWLADANYAKTVGFRTYGNMTPDAVVGFVEFLNYSAYLGVSTWRQPEWTGFYGCTYRQAFSDCGYNVRTDSGELAHLFYSTLGNLAIKDNSGNPQSGGGLTNTGPFVNMASSKYWYGTPHDSGNTYFFDFSDGKQFKQANDKWFKTMLLVDGDVAPPLPPATWMDTLEARDLDGDQLPDAYYDTELDITWLVDADLMTTLGWGPNTSYDIPELHFPEYLNSIAYLGITEWRLPLPASLVSQNVGEIQHLYTTTLGNAVYPDPRAGFGRTGPFRNLAEVEYVYHAPVKRWPPADVVEVSNFDMATGLAAATGSAGRAWPVVNGDAGLPVQGTWQSTLQARDYDADGLVDAYYDTVLDITWLADASGTTESLVANEMALHGITSWRTPALENPNVSVGELQHLYAITLGNALSPDPAAGLVERGPLLNLAPRRYYYDFLREFYYDFDDYVEGTYMDMGTGQEVYDYWHASGVPLLVVDGDPKPPQITRPQFEIIDLGSLGGDLTRVNEVNDLGEVVGYSRDASGVNKAFLYTGGSMLNLGTLSAGNTGESFARGLNNLGDVVGYSDTDAGIQTAFLYSAGGMAPIGTVPDDPDSAYIRSARDINDAGAIALDYFEGPDRGRQWGVLDATGTLHIDPESEGGGAAIGIDEAGNAAGYQTPYKGDERSDFYAQFVAGVFTEANNSYVSGAGDDSHYISWNGLTEFGVLFGRNWGETCGFFSGCYSWDNRFASMLDDAAAPCDFCGAIRIIANDGSSIGDLIGRSEIETAEGVVYGINDLVNFPYAGYQENVTLMSINEHGDIAVNAKTLAGEDRGLLLRAIRPSVVAGIDVAPGDPANKVYPDTDQALTVAVLTTSVEEGDAQDFDGASVIQGTVRLGTARASVITDGWQEDVDGDGDLDSVFGFRTDETGILCEDTEVSMTGRTAAGLDFSATSSIDATDCDGGCHP